MKYFLTILSLWALFGCHASTPMQTYTGRYVMATTHRIQFDLEKPGSLNSQLILPLDPKAQVTIAGRTESIAKLRSGEQIILTRNMTTHQVVRIDAQ